MANVILKEIAAFIVTNTSFVLGTTLQYGFLSQNAPARCVGLRQSGGKPNFYFADQNEYRLQVVTRAENYVDANEDADTIYALIHTLSEQSLADKYLIMTSEAVQTPQYINMDIHGRHQFSTNYILRIMNFVTGS